MMQNDTLYRMKENFLFMGIFLLPFILSALASLIWSQDGRILVTGAILNIVWIVYLDASGGV